MNWEEAIKRFKISKLHEVACLDHIKKLNMGIGQVAEKWVSKPHSMYISGSPGTGKTYLLVALLREAIQSQKYNWIIFVRSNDLDAELLDAIGHKQEAFCLEKYYEVPILMIDDLGVEKVSERLLKQYYNILDRRLNNLYPTVITSNIARDEIHLHLGDRIASRLGMAAEVKFPNKDFRNQIKV
jgi:DNA replication protein DnaC